MLLRTATPKPSFTLFRTPASPKPLFFQIKRPLHYSLTDVPRTHRVPGQELINRDPDPSLHIEKLITSRPMLEHQYFWAADTGRINRTLAVQALELFKIPRSRITLIAAAAMADDKRIEELVNLMSGGRFYSVLVVMGFDRSLSQHVLGGRYKRLLQLAEDHGQRTAAVLNLHNNLDELHEEIRAKLNLGVTMFNTQPIFGPLPPEVTTWTMGLIRQGIDINFGVINATLRLYARRMDFPGGSRTTQQGGDRYLMPPKEEAEGAEHYASRTLQDSLHFLSSLCLPAPEERVYTRDEPGNELVLEALEASRFAAKPAKGDWKPAATSSLAGIGHSRE